MIFAFLLDVETTGLDLGRSEVTLSIERVAKEPRADLYAKFLNVVDAVVWQADPVTFQCSFVTPSAERLFGYSVEEWAQPGFWDRCLHPDDRERVLQERVRGIQALKPFGMECRLIRDCGTPVWVHHDVTVELQNGKPIRLLGVTTDITGRKRTEQRLAAHISISHILEDSPSIREAAPKLLKVLSQQLGWDEAYFWLVEDPSAPLQSLASWPPDSRERTPAAGPQGLLCRALMAQVQKSGETLWISDLTKDLGPLPPEAIDSHRSGSALCFPLALEKRVLGTVVLLADHAQPRDESMVPWLEALGRSVSQFHKRRGAEERVRLSEERVARAERIAHLGHWEADLGTYNGFWSDEEFRILGLSPAPGEADFDRFISRVHPGDRENLIRITHETISSGKPATFKFRVVLPDGTIRTIRAQQELVRDHAGKPTRLSGTNLDITEMETANEALRQSEERFRLLGSFAAVGIFTNDARGQCTYINEAGAKLCGTTPEQVLGLEWSRIIHPEDRERVTTEFFAAVQSGRNYQGEYRFLTPDQSTPWISTVVVPLKGAGGELRGFVGTLVDISEHKRLGQLKDEFISTVSHELRTPITAIRGALKLIAAGVTGELQPKTRRLIDVAHDSCERLVRLVNDILDVERIETGRLTLNIQPLSLAPLVATAEEAIRPYALGFGIRVEIENLAPRAWVQVDQDRFVQVLTNLLSNAVKFSPAGAVVKIAVSEQGGKVRLSVIDRGMGIPSAFRAKIFSKFSQADSSDSRSKIGSGLGLNIAKSIVEKLGGQIGFDSTEGAGSTFSVELPLYQDPAATCPPPQPGRPTILSIEDDPHFSSVLLGILDSAGFNAVLAGSAREAKELLGKNTYAAMTLDLGLPDEDGLSLLRELRRTPEGRTLPVIVISAHLDETNRVARGDAIGIIDWLGKPIDEKQLKSALQRITFPDGARARILHVEDDPRERDAVHRCLEGKAEVFSAGTLADAVRRLGSEAFDLLILDAELPDGSGVELLPHCKLRNGRRLPIILYSNEDASPTLANEVSAILRKSTNSSSDLVAAIRSILSNQVFGTVSANPGGRP